MKTNYLRELDDLNLDNFLDDFNFSWAMDEVKHAGRGSDIALIQLLLLKILRRLEKLEHEK